MAFDFDFLPFDDFPLFTQAIVNTFHILLFVTSIIAQWLVLWLSNFKVIRIRWLDYSCASKRGQRFRADEFEHGFVTLYTFHFKMAQHTNFATKTVHTQVINVKDLTIVIMNLNPSAIIKYLTSIPA